MLTKQLMPFRQTLPESKRPEIYMHDDRVNKGWSKIVAKQSVASSTFTIYSYSVVGINEDRVEFK